MSMQRKTLFNPSHSVDFGLKVCERDPISKEVVSVVCLFCIHFGREEKIGAKRKPTTNATYFKKPFRVDVYTRHFNQQHPTHWQR